MATSQHPTRRLLAQIVDVYLPDLKYGCDPCANRWSGTPNYVATVQSSIAAIAGAGIPTIVRVLVLPGHFNCCHEPALHFLSSLPRHGPMSVSIRAQYSPDWRISRQTTAIWLANPRRARSSKYGVVPSPSGSADSLALEAS